MGRKRSRAGDTAAAARALLLLLRLLIPARAYQPADGPGQVCRLLRLDETSFTLPLAKAGGDLPAVTLTDDQDLRPLFEGGNSLGEGAALRLDAWVPGTSARGGGRCVPDAITLTAGSGGLRIWLPPPASGWEEGQWNAVEASVAPEALVQAATWEDLEHMVVSYACDPADGKSEEQGQEAEAAALKVRLIRLCKPVPGPSLCLVSSTVEAKTDCGPCNCQTCHDCECVTTLLGGKCPFDECTDACPGAPIFKCCYNAPCG